MPIFSPNHNAFRRLGGTVNAATRASWGFEDRDACVRIPESDPRNLRVEHRLASADANPYLVLAAILVGLEHGLEAKREPIAPLNEDRSSGSDFPWKCSKPYAPCSIKRCCAISWAPNLSTCTARTNARITWPFNKRSMRGNTAGFFNRPWNHR